MDQHITRIVLTPHREPIFSEHAYAVEIEDEASGMFIKVESELGDPKSGAISINVEDWQQLRSVINRMVKHAAKWNEDNA
jgi:hypothetical protein